MANSPNNVSSFLGSISYSNYKPGKHTFSQQESPANLSEAHKMKKQYFGNFHGAPYKKFRGDSYLYDNIWNYLFFIFLHINYLLNRGGF